MISTLSKKHSFDGVFDSQKVFRLILEAMSHPARVVSINEYADKLFGEAPVFLSVAMTLLDNEVSFNACDNQVLADEIISLTLAKQDEVNDSDFIFVNDLNYKEYAIANAKSGTLSDPHKSAMVVIQDDFESSCRMTLSGPGIDGQITVQTTQTVKDAVSLRDAQNYEYPQGIDLIFISSIGELLAIPRLVMQMGDINED